MKLAISVGAIDNENLQDMTNFVVHADKLGVDYAWSHEAWGTDAVSPLAYLAAKTQRIRLGTGIIQVSTRTPVMIAMTALTLDTLSQGRFTLGLGTSGPQVVEGLHGAAYTGALSRLKETVDIVRLALRGEKIEYRGTYHELPRPSGEGKSLRLDCAPKPELPIYLATLGPRALRYTGAAADGWLGTSFSPEHAFAHLDYIAQGADDAGRRLTEVDLQVACHVSIGQDVERLISERKAAVAFSLGAMGSVKTNFYNDAYRRAGYDEDAKAVQSLWMAGQRDAARARVPDKLVTLFGAVGTPAMIRERFQAYKNAGVNCLCARFEGTKESEKYGVLEQVCELVATLD
ncbi:MAG: LLM class flavin-dependent oxidoreductase [Proteobacteria bacterium]|nr:LLM class flavin-dependent oxidoreductase [Pseudomonadota bacterium]